MINAGAILTCSLLQALIKPEMTIAEKFDYIMSWFKRLSGGEFISFNNAVFLSEREAADRNYALGFYMRENKCYPQPTNLKDVMDFYFQVIKILLKRLNLIICTNLNFSVVQWKQIVKRWL